MDALAISRRIAHELASISQASPVRVRAWNGEEWGPADAPVTLVLQHEGSLRALLDPPTSLAAGEAYVYGDIDIEGDIVALLRLGSDLASSPRLRLRAARAVRLARRLPSGFRRDAALRPRFRGLRHSRRRDLHTVTHHYDTGNEFFACFLDPAMVYSCAAFLSPEEDLETAQRRKLDLICRKLSLRPGMRFLDVGCGWGALVLHAARHYGVEATGVTLSAPQAALARRRAKEAGLEGSVRILEQDYREVGGAFDAIASVGMFEHVGARKLSTYFGKLRSLLVPGGQLLNHGIVTRDRRLRRPRSRSFLGTYVFPDGELRPVEETIGVAERAGFELRDAEALRAGYALTLRRWVANLERNEARAVAIAGTRVYRTWRLYMAGSAVAFERASIGIYQLLLSDPARPWTFGRRHLLAEDDLEREQTRLASPATTPDGDQRAGAGSEPR